MFSGIQFLLSRAGSPEYDVSPCEQCQAIEEFLRYNARSTTSMLRFAKEDVRIGEMLIRAGEAVLCVFILAKRDLPITCDADILEISCPDIRHMPFGHGIHFCSGAPLAQLELAISCRTMLDRYQSMTLVTERASVRKADGHDAAASNSKLEFTPALPDANAVEGHLD
jgi:cytochrome P450